MRDGTGDCFEDTLSIAHHLMIVEPQNAVTFVREKGIPPRVACTMLRCEMLATVDFDDQASSMTNKIDDVGTNRCLTPETRTIQAVCAYCVPNDAFSIGRIKAQGSRAPALFG